MINRNNYEEYLLMYIDGELSPAEAKAVEAFLDVNPDLKEELQLLQQTVLEPEESITFSGKDLLYRKEEGINLSNYQEYFLLYVDEELSSTQREAVETFVLKNPQLQDEFTLLKQTVLPKEEIIFVNKEVLYRKEEKRRPVVISMRWASLAAAVMIGIVALVWVMNSGNKNNGTDPNSFAGQVKQQKNTNPETTPSTKPDQTLPADVNGGTTLAAKDQQNLIQPQKNTKVQQVQQQQAPGQQIAVVPQPKNEQKAVEPQVPYRETDPIAYNPTRNETNTGAGDNTKITGVSTPDIATNSFVQPAVYTEELNTDDDKNNNLYVGALEINTDKVRGFFRKAGRFLSSKVKKEDGDKVQVANIEVNKLK
jgi:cytoskeletal protein RodZ